MLLSDRDISAELASGNLIIQPWEEELLQPSSIDVRLDQTFRVFNNSRHTHIDPAIEQDDLTELVEPKGGEPFVLHPGEFVLGCTLEGITIPQHLAARLEGKSSLGRLGLLTHATAGFIDPGWKGTLTLELNNLTRVPIKLYPGLLIAQLSFMGLDRAAERPYGSKELGSHYQGQVAATESRYMR